MAKHKAATEITIVTEERSALAQLVDRYKFHFLAAVIAVSGAILFVQSRGHAAQVEDQAQWESVYDALGGKAFGVQPSVQDLDAEALQRVATKLGDQPAASWSRMMAAYAYAEDANFSSAREVATQLKNSQNPLLTKFTLPLGKDGAEVSLADHLDASIQATEAFRKQYEHLYVNPDPPVDAPVVVLETTKGNIEVALYSDLAPKHVENFLKLARENFYDGTRFHRVMKDFMIQGGDPNSKDLEAPETWGQGGPGYKIDREENKLIHLPMYLAAAKMGQDVQSSGSQFYITTGAPHHLDGVHVVYGKVIGGESVVRAIEEGAPDPTNPQRPLDPVVLNHVSVRGD
ncbi:MAG: peptidylprolyl isomerase [Planctomycetota bacterium]